MTNDAQDISQEQPLVFANIGWMVKYSGPSRDDPTLGNFGYLKTDTVGHEAWNFKPLRGKVYGYVPRSAQIRIERLGAARGESQLAGVTVVWLARSPRDKKTYIVGWYNNATVHRSSNSISLARAKSFRVAYQIEAPASSATLLTPDARIFSIPTAKEPGNLGQSPIWYGKDESFRSTVRTYISGGKLPITKKKSTSAKQPDPELRRKIERAAVAHATKYYSSRAGGSRTVESVETLGCGWDLEATAFDGSVLKVEVKGLSGKDVVVELTPNEYARMISAEHRSDYVVYIVTEALEKSARAHVFRHDALLSKGKDLVWSTDDFRKLKIQPLTAARLSSEKAVQP